MNLTQMLGLALTAVVVTDDQRLVELENPILQGVILWIVHSSLEQWHIVISNKQITHSVVMCE